MIEVANALWVGSQLDYEQIDNPHEWAVVHACKEPYHRQELGYTTRGAPKDHPEYLFCERDNRLILNLVDVDDPKYVAPEIIHAAVEFIRKHQGKNIIVHCNQGRSRSPTIAMLYLASTLGGDFEAAEEAMRSRYPDYAPANGMREFARANWDTFHKRPE